MLGEKTPVETRIEWPKFPWDHTSKIVFLLTGLASACAIAATFASDNLQKGLIVLAILIGGGTFVCAVWCDKVIQALQKHAHDVVLSSRGTKEWLRRMLAETTERTSSIQERMDALQKSTTESTNPRGLAAALAASDLMEFCSQKRQALIDAVIFIALLRKGILSEQDVCVIVDRDAENFRKSIQEFQASLDEASTDLDMKNVAKSFRGQAERILKTVPLRTKTFKAAIDLAFGHSLSKQTGEGPQ